MNGIRWNHLRRTLPILAVLWIVVSGCGGEGGAQAPTAIVPDPLAAPRPPTATLTAPPTPTLVLPALTPTIVQAKLPSAPVVGALAPDFVLSDVQGDKLALHSLRGKRVLLNFWTTW